MSKTYMRKEKGDDTIICVALSTWGSHRAKGYVFVESDKDGKTPEQQFVAQGQKAAPAKKKASKKK